MSDVSCPWCVIGLKSLEQALENVGDAASAELHFQPFELNPQMAPEGQDIGEHLAQKYGASAAQRAETGEMIRARGAELGFTFGQRDRIYNTFDAHRLLHWAEEQGLQRELKMALFDAYFTEGYNPGSHDVLVRVAGRSPRRRRSVPASSLPIPTPPRCASANSSSSATASIRCPNYHQPAPPDLRRPAARGVRAGAAPDPGRRLSAGASAAWPSGQAMSPFWCGAQHQRMNLTQTGGAR